MSCSTYPKCSGRISWGSLEKDLHERWAKRFDEHEKAHPNSSIRKLDGTTVGEGFKPGAAVVENDEMHGD